MQKVLRFYLRDHEICVCGCLYLFSAKIQITDSMQPALSCGLGSTLRRGEAGADPGFPVGGGANPPGGHQYMILPNFAKNCMKVRKFWAGGAPPINPPLRGACNSSVSVLDPRGRQHAHARSIFFPFLAVFGKIIG